MEYVYPAGPTTVPQDLTRPSTAYKRHAWIAMGVLALFVVLYVALSGWFIATAIRLIPAGGNDAWQGIFLGLCAAFLAVFMVKALFFVQRGAHNNDLEIKREDQPRLFDFLDRLADEAGAPRPHRVFLSPRVNAAVFYDLTIFNLLFPSRKNLEIGLGLVNVLSLPEFKAVCAHEFGHFAQRTMAVGRWVYISQQIVSHIVGKRDVLDKFLQGLSRMDFRIAWIGWVLSLIVWSIRSLLETVFHLVVLAQRALSREMEMQADLVAVSLTGSDELIHALHRLTAADDAWNRTLDFVGGELAQKRMPQDAFILQQRIIERMARLYDTPEYGNPPPLPKDNPAAHRIFAQEIAQPPKMWQTHPFNHEREANAKRVYVAATTDKRSAWEAFEDVSSLKEKVTALLRGSAEATITPTADAIKTLDEQFDREYLNDRYRGIYWGRSTVRWAAGTDEFYQQVAATTLSSVLDSLYPSSLADDLSRLRELEREKSMLEFVHQGRLTAPGNQIRFRDREVRIKDIPKVIKELLSEISTIDARLRNHDRLCRSAHLSAARLVGDGWDAYLTGLLRVLHFADHSEANLRDLQGCLGNIVAIETATRRVSKSGLDRIMNAAIDLHNAFDRLNAFCKTRSPDDLIRLDTRLCAKLQIENWLGIASKHELSAPSRDNIGKWLEVVDGWTEQWAGALGKLKLAALDELLLSERLVADAFRARTPLPAAPDPSIVSGRYAVLQPGRERKRQSRLGWWARFQTADGIPASALRLLVAGGIVGAVLGFGGNVGNATVTVYNGLARNVVVKIDNQSVHILPFGTASLTVKPMSHIAVEARDESGHLIESFSEDASSTFENYVYDVAAAGPLIEWVAVYGNNKPVPERPLGAKRWQISRVDDLFKEPPRTIQTKHGKGGIRRVLSGYGNGTPDDVLGLLPNAEERKAVTIQHVRWDSPHSAYIMDWLESASQLPEFAEVLADRLARDPGDVVALRMEQQISRGDAHQKVCEKHTAMSAAAPENSTLRYLSDRCIADSRQQENAFQADYQRWPNDPWLAFVAGYRMFQAGNWKDGQAAMETAIRRETALANSVALDVARVRRYSTLNQNAPMADLLPISEALRRIRQIETGSPDLGDALQAYPDLAKGNLDGALHHTQGSPMAPRVLRLIAASEGARPELIQKALDLPAEQGIDVSTLWTAAALAAREHRNVDAYFAILKNQENNEMIVAMLHFFEQLRADDLAGASRQLDLLSPELRGQACSMGVVYLGQKAPPEWRMAAKLLLFAPERPYFM